jgi:hypothetical protein
VLLASGLALAAPGAVPAAGAAEPQTAKDIIACMTARAPKADDVRSLRVTTVDRAGQERVIRIDAYGRLAADGSRRMLLRFSEPEELQGSSFLVVQSQGSNDYYLHTPALGGQRRIQGGELGASLFGTDFSYEDIARYQGLLTDGEVERKADTTVAGRPAFVLEARPPEETSSYTRVVSAVDRERCLLLEASMYEQAGEPRKVLSTDPDSVLCLDSHCVPQRATLRDLRDGSRTELEVRSVVSAAVPDQLFDPASLGKVRPRLEFSPDKPAPRIELDRIEPPAPAR